MPKQGALFVPAVYCAACTVQVKLKIVTAQKSIGDAFYQVSLLYNLGFLTAGFSSYLSCYCGIIK